MLEILSFNQVEFNWLKDESLIKSKQFSFLKNNTYFIYGPSGSGKSTLLSLLTGFIKPSSGSIDLLGQNISDMSDSKLNKYRSEHIGFIFQNFNLIPYLSAFENIQLPLSFLNKKPSFNIYEMAKKLKITHCLNKNTQYLSHGEQQRVALLKALVTKPEILVCDEPTSALDVDVENQFLDLLFSEYCKDMTIIFVSHDLRLKEKFDHYLSIEVFKDV